MSYHASNPTSNSNDETSELSSALFSDEKSEVSSIQQFFNAEERREKAAARSSVRAMRQKFEQASLTTDHTPRHSVSCGSSIAERKRHLQQVLDLDLEERDEQPLEARHTPARRKESKMKAATRRLEGAKKDSMPARRKESKMKEATRRLEGAKEDCTPPSRKEGTKKEATRKLEDTKDDSMARMLRNRRALALSMRRRQSGNTSNIGDKKKLFEKNESTDDMSRGAGTVMTEATTKFGTDAEPESVLARKVSDSDFDGALEYDGSFFSAEPPAVRDEVEATRHPQILEEREEESFVSQRKSPEEESTSAIALSPNNSFQEALHEIVSSFQEDTDVQQTPLGHTSSSNHVTENHGFTTPKTTKQKPVFVMDTNQFGHDVPSPVSMLSSFDTDAGLASDNFGTNCQGQAANKEVGSSGPMVKSTRNLSPSAVLPNSSVFSTVEQEEERERSQEAFMEYGPYDEPFQESFSFEYGPQDAVQSPQPEPTEIPQVPVECAPEEAVHTQQAAPAVMPQDSSEYALGEAVTPDPIISTSPELFEHAPEKAAHPPQDGPTAISQELPQGAGCNEEVEERQDVDDPSVQSPRYEFVQKLEEAIIKTTKKDVPQSGNCQGKIDIASIPRSPVFSADTLCTVSSADSEQLQNAVPASMMQNRRFSIGGYVNAHLSENPETDFGHPQWQQAHQVEDKGHQSSISPHRQDRRASTSSPANPHDRDRAMSPCSMDPQFSQSNQHDQAEDLQQIANAMTSIANNASTILLDVLVDTADNLVVSPLLSIFSCVDQSEGVLCSGKPTEQCCGGGAFVDNKKRRRVPRRKHRRSRSRSRGSRKFKA